jgi:hypothetical protein
MTSAMHLIRSASRLSFIIKPSSYSDMFQYVMVLLQPCGQHVRGSTACVLCRAQVGTVQLASYGPYKSNEAASTCSKVTQAT